MDEPTMHCITWDVECAGCRLAEMALQYSEEAMAYARGEDQGNRAEYLCGNCVVVQYLGHRFVRHVGPCCEDHDSCQTPKDTLVLTQEQEGELQDIAFDY